jgi:hypothetical protein
VARIGAQATAGVVVAVVGGFVIGSSSRLAGRRLDRRSVAPAARP